MNYKKLIVWFYDQIEQIILKNGIVLTLTLFPFITDWQEKGKKEITLDSDRQSKSNTTR